MEKIILKTSAQVKIERDMNRRNTSCPECGGHCLGIYSTRTTGFFKVRTERKHNYRCIKCNCEWTTGWN
ncbi:hypothetical protein [Metabacillus sp. Hm71]|uniref:hypothetical protein n=1 Tax=Metabacillus sp. Hm71 TaxID=3450743 RepID=UPI003F42B6CC